MRSEPALRVGAVTTTQPAGSSLQGRIVVVTGGAQGLGAELVRVFSEAGAVPIVADVQVDAASSVVAELRDEGREAGAIELDVSSDASATAAVGTLIERYRRIDVLVNNAGVDRTAPFIDLTMDDWDRIISVNLRGPILMSRLVFDHMDAMGGGHIVNITSTAAKRAWANASAYHATKWGLLGFSHALHVEGRACGVKVTAVVAGGMRTPFLLDRFPDIDLDVLQEPRAVAEAVRYAVTQPEGTVIPELTVLPTRETSWP